MFHDLLHWLDRYIERGPGLLQRGRGPAWGDPCVVLPWQVYLHCGDRRVLEVNYPVIQKWLKFYE